MSDQFTTTHRINARILAFERRLTRLPSKPHWCAAAMKLWSTRAMARRRVRWNKTAPSYRRYVLSLERTQ